MASQPLSYPGPAQGGEREEKCLNFSPSSSNPEVCHLCHKQIRHAPCMIVFPNHCCILKFLWFLVSLFLIFLPHFRCESCLLILSISFVWFLCFLQLLSKTSFWFDISSCFILILRLCFFRLSSLYDVLPY